MGYRYIMLVRQVCFALLVLIASVLSLAAETPQSRYGDLPLLFEPNQGQSDAPVRFLTLGNGYSLFLTDTEAVLSIVRPSEATVRMRLAGQTGPPRIDGLERQAGVSNYFRGADPQHWQQAVP